ncbi:hypothetical protein HPB51_022371 [Rhipicephalus microplus]|uniref:Uncharacterized protein n=1 Tax=Rhipicephalus microplus TaxID=6941 RepID=A0A9J6DQ97_RHIMP|nr:hypothetical protein HPB51_022371 [Rhipicephalus microplus]
MVTTWPPDDVVQYNARWSRVSPLPQDARAGASQARELWASPRRDAMREATKIEVATRNFPWTAQRRVLERASCAFSAKALPKAFFLLQSIPDERARPRHNHRAPAKCVPSPGRPTPWGLFFVIPFCAARPSYVFFCVSSPHRLIAATLKQQKQGTPQAMRHNRLRPKECGWPRDGVSRFGPSKPRACLPLSDDDRRPFWLSRRVRGIGKRVRAWRSSPRCRLDSVDEPLRRPAATLPRQWPPPKFPPAASPRPCSHLQLLDVAACARVCACNTGGSWLSPPLPRAAISRIFSPSMHAAQRGNFFAFSFGSPLGASLRLL